MVLKSLHIQCTTLVNHFSTQSHLWSTVSVFFHTVSASVLFGVLVVWHFLEESSIVVTGIFFRPLTLILQVMMLTFSRSYQVVVMKVFR